MEIVNQSTHISLAIHLGMVGVMVSILVWRMNATKEMYFYYSKIRDLKKRGFASPRSIRDLQLLITEFLLRIIGVVLSAVVLYLSFSYLMELRKIFGSNLELDYALFQKIWGESEHITAKAIAFASWSILLFILNYCLLIWIENRLNDIKQKAPINFYNTYTIPSEMKSNPESLWIYRILEFKKLNQEFLDKIDLNIDEVLSSKSWRNEWTTWTKCVIAHNVLVSKKLENRKENIHMQENVIVSTK